MIDHTPGPWSIDKGLTGESASFDIHGDGVWIGAIHGDHYTPGERPSEGFPGNNEAKANALLVVEAPALKEALEVLMRSVPCYCQPDALCGVHEAQAIIDRIEGRDEPEPPTPENEDDIPF